MSKETKYYCDVCKKEKELGSIRTDFSELLEMEKNNDTENK